MCLTYYLQYQITDESMFVFSAPFIVSEFGIIQLH